MLATLLARTASGRPGAVILHGEAGVGKTTLVHALVDEARAADMGVLWGTCLRFGSASLPHAPIVGALRTWLADAAEGDTEGADRAGRADASAPGGGHRDDDWRSTLVRASGALEALTPSPHGPPHHGTTPVLTLVDDLVATICARAPTLLVVDDLHWADTASLDVLAYLVTGLRHQRLALVLAYRDEERRDGHPLHEWLADVRRMPAVDELAVGRLTSEETRDQIAGTLGSTPSINLGREVFERSRATPTSPTCSSTG